MDGRDMEKDKRTMAHTSEPCSFGTSLKARNQSSGLCVLHCVRNPFPSITLNFLENGGPPEVLASVVVTAQLWKDGMKKSLSGVTAVEILASKDIVFDNLQLDALEIGSNYTITFSAYFRGETVVFGTNPITFIGEFLRPDSQDLFYYVGQTFDTLNVQMRSTDFTRAVSARINNSLFFFEDNYQSYQIAFTEGFYSIDGVNSELRLKLEDLGIAVDLFSFTKVQDKVVINVAFEGWRVIFSASGSIGSFLGFNRDIPNSNEYTVVPNMQFTADFARQSLPITLPAGQAACGRFCAVAHSDIQMKDKFNVSVKVFDVGDGQLKGSIYGETVVAIDAGVASFSSIRANGLVGSRFVLVFYLDQVSVVSAVNQQIRDFYQQSSLQYPLQLGLFPDTLQIDWSSGNVLVDESVSTMSVTLVDSAMPLTTLVVVETDGFILDIELLNSNQNLNLQYLGGTTTQYVESAKSLFADLKILGTAGTGYVFKVCLSNQNSILPLCTQTATFVVYPQGISIVESTWPKYLYEDQTFPQISIRMIGSSLSNLRFFNTDAFEIEVSLLRHGIRRPTAFSSTPKLIFTGLQDVKFNNLRVFDELGSEYQLLFVLNINAAFLSAATSSSLVTQRAVTPLFDMIPRGVQIQEVSDFNCGGSFQASVSLVTFAMINLIPADGFEVSLVLVASEDLGSESSLQGTTKRNITGTSVTFSGLQLLSSSPSCIGTYRLNYTLTCLFSGQTYGPYQSNAFRVLPYNISFQFPLPTNLLEGELLPTVVVQVQGANGDVLSGLTGSADKFGLVSVQLYRDESGPCAAPSSSPSSAPPLPNLHGRKELNLTSGKAEFSDLTIFGIIGSCYVLVANYTVPSMASFVLRSTTFRLWPNSLSSNLTNECDFNNFPSINCSLLALVGRPLPPVVVRPILRDMSGSWELEAVDQLYVGASLVSCETRCKQTLRNSSCEVDYYPPRLLTLSTSFAGSLVERQLDYPIFGVSAASFDIKRISQNSSWPGHPNCLSVELRANVDLLGGQGASITVSGLSGLNLRSQTGVRLVDSHGNDLSSMWFKSTSWKQGIGELAVQLRDDVTLAAGQELNFTLCARNSMVAQESPAVVVEANGGVVIPPSLMEKGHLSDLSTLLVDLQASAISIGYSSLVSGRSYVLSFSLVNPVSQSPPSAVSVQVASPQLQTFVQGLTADNRPISGLLGSVAGDAAPFYVQNASVAFLSLYQSSSFPYPASSAIILRVGFNFRIAALATLQLTGFADAVLLSNATLSYKAANGTNVTSPATIDVVGGKLSIQTDMALSAGRELFVAFSVENPKWRVNQSVTLETTTDLYNSSLLLSSEVGRYLVEAPGFHSATIRRNTSYAGMPAKVTISLLCNIPLLAGSVLTITSSSAVFQLAQVCWAAQNLVSVTIEPERVSLALLTNLTTLQAIDVSLCATNDAQSLPPPSFLLAANLISPGTCSSCYETIDLVSLDGGSMQIDPPGFTTAQITQTNPFPLGKNTIFITLIPNFLVNVNSSVTFTFSLGSNETLGDLLSDLSVFPSDLSDSYQVDAAGPSIRFLLSRDVRAGEVMLFAWNVSNPAGARNSTPVSVSCSFQGLVRVASYQLQEDSSAIAGQLWSIRGDKLPFRVSPPAIPFGQAHQSTNYPGRSNEISINFALTVEMPAGSKFTLAGLDIACSGSKDMVVYGGSGSTVPTLSSSCPANTSITCAIYDCSSLSLLLELANSLPAGEVIAFKLTLQNPSSVSFLDSSYLDSLTELDCTPAGGQLTGQTSRQLGSSFLFDRLVVGGAFGFFAIEFDLIHQVVGNPVRTRGRSDRFLVAPASIQLDPSQLDSEYQTSPAVLSNSSHGNLPLFLVSFLDQLGRVLNVSSPGIRVVAHLLKSGHVMDEFLEGQTIQRAQGYSAKFTDLRIAYLTGRNFSLTFSIELGSRSLSSSTSHFNILPSALKANGCPGDVLTGQSFQLTFHLVDQNGVVLSADDGSFSIEIDLLLDGAPSSQYLLGHRTALIKDDAISFPDLRILNVSGSNFRFQFTLAVDGQPMGSMLNSSGSSDCTSSFSVFPSSMRLVPQADCISSFLSGELLSSFTLEVLDVEGKPIETVSDPSFALVKASLLPAQLADQLNGTTQVPLSSGRVTFSSLRAPIAGISLRLLFELQLSITTAVISSNSSAFVVASDPFDVLPVSIHLENASSVPHLLCSAHPLFLPPLHFLLLDVNGARISAALDLKIAVSLYNSNGEDLAGKIQGSSCHDVSSSSSSALFTDLLIEVSDVGSFSLLFTLNGPLCNLYQGRSYSLDLNSSLCQLQDPTSILDIQQYLSNRTSTAELVLGGEEEAFGLQAKTLTFMSQESGSNLFLDAQFPFLQNSSSLGSFSPLDAHDVTISSANFSELSVKLPDDLVRPLAYSEVTRFSQWRGAEISERWDASFEPLKVAYYTRAAGKKDSLESDVQYDVPGRVFPPDVQLKDRRTLTPWAARYEGSSFQLRKQRWRDTSGNGQDAIVESGYCNWPGPSSGRPVVMGSGTEVILFPEGLLQESFTLCTAYRSANGKTPWRLVRNQNESDLWYEQTFQQSQMTVDEWKLVCVFRDVTSIAFQEISYSGDHSLPSSLPAADRLSLIFNPSSSWSLLELAVWPRVLGAADYGELVTFYNNMAYSDTLPSPTPAMKQAPHMPEIFRCSAMPTLPCRLPSGNLCSSSSSGARATGGSVGYDGVVISSEVQVWVTRDYAPGNEELQVSSLELLGFRRDAPLEQDVLVSFAGYQLQVVGVSWTSSSVLVTPNYQTQVVLANTQAVTIVNVCGYEASQPVDIAIFSAQVAAGPVKVFYSIGTDSSLPLMQEASWAEAGGSGQVLLGAGNISQLNFITGEVPSFAGPRRSFRLDTDPCSLSVDSPCQVHEMCVSIPDPLSSPSFWCIPNIKYCLPGYAYSPLNLSCQACPPNTFKSKNCQQDCGVCRSCPPRSFSPPASVIDYDCSCPDRLTTLQEFTLPFVRGYQVWEEIDKWGYVSSMPLPWGETSQVSWQEVLNLTLSGSASILGTSTQLLNSDQQHWCSHVLVSNNREFYASLTSDGALEIRNSTSDEIQWRSRSGPLLENSICYHELPTDLVNFTFQLSDQGAQIVFSPSSEGTSPVVWPQLDNNDMHPSDSVILRDDGSLVGANSSSLVWQTIAGDLLGNFWMCYMDQCCWSSKMSTGGSQKYLRRRAGANESVTCEDSIFSVASGMRFSVGNGSLSLYSSDSTSAVMSSQVLDVGDSDSLLYFCPYGLCFSSLDSTSAPLSTVLVQNLSEAILHRFTCESSGSVLRAPTGLLEASHPHNVSRNCSWTVLPCANRSLRLFISAETFQQGQENCSATGNFLSISLCQDSSCSSFQQELTICPAGREKFFLATSPGVGVKVSYVADVNVILTSSEKTPAGSSQLEVNISNSSTFNTSDVNSTSANSTYLNTSNATNASSVPAGASSIAVDSWFSASWFQEPVDDLGGCNFTWTSQNGTNYSSLKLNGSSMEGPCSWILEASNGSVVSFIVNELQGANSSGCGDFLLVETCDGVSCSSWTPAEKICARAGVTAKIFHTSEGGRMRVTVGSEETISSSFALLASWIESSVHVGRSLTLEADGALVILTATDIFPFRF
ncbi:hypothetical protein GUITHDRAFT_141667 [Guillardia theta CCMP2712]|uniref:Uncharacterized protein n=1 Tax=Guillardia theta (strain CCMP2712) TaxID=905079 RepID=L1J1H0_GUITC|nr:hypothetical protein GUITHDRAFT_141667 [Guillardia theta CCMP2712]EKX41930.1 hypothetical protein GUITHDRAFT_141667 [Guillardia theta CCMP2712]|eukprot:XP_005828910.1 hypothetical protein GUITHDRAFT_141667 [Guillardia theta CCMP2712]